jgi:protein TonB
MFESRSFGARGLWLALSLGAHAVLGLSLVRQPALITTAYALTPRALALSAPNLEIEEPPGPRSVETAPPAPPASEPPRLAVARSSRVVSATGAPQVAAAPIPRAQPAVAIPQVSAPASVSAAVPRFVIAVSPSHPSSSGVAPTSASPHAIASNALPGANAPRPSNSTGAPFSEAAVDTRARLLRGDAPLYTQEADAAGVEAEIPFEIVIDENGAVASAHALAHVGYGLDAAAERGILGYRFAPARRQGIAVPVRMRWQLRFQLR